MHPRIWSSIVVVAASIPAIGLAWADVAPSPPPADPSELRNRIIAGVLAIAVAGLLWYRRFRKPRIKAPPPADLPPALADPATGAAAPVEKPPDK